MQLFTLGVSYSFFRWVKGELNCEQERSNGALRDVVMTYS